ncbi:hypothetical protein GYMLUDRAFT_916793 [Collybiopsis luxurians FD-317 M1]|uniref:Uncharacterized protein n=1 Tax=Collybiopsis luxurians FD-317 M1 TaxID=944289 RepID=A0A0D0BWY7_9AGAR|nr:hypothetical protein GYMLUDRAFT_916793 [Collybiopsis luxurians FD-317 M1]
MSSLLTRASGRFPMFNSGCHRRCLHLFYPKVARVYKVTEWTASGPTFYSLIPLRTERPFGSETAQFAWRVLRMFQGFPYLCSQTSILVITYDYLAWPGQFHSLELHLPLRRYLAQQWRIQNPTFPPADADALGGGGGGSCTI